MSENRDHWTLGDYIAHVGGTVNPDLTVTFGSAMAVDALVHLMLQPWREYVQDQQLDIATALAMAKSHIAEVNVELAEARVALALAAAATRAEV